MFAGEMVLCKQRKIIGVNRVQGDSRVIMSLTKFVMQPTLHLHRLCGFKKIYFNLVRHNM
jgi:hypothetical protein